MPDLPHTLELAATRTINYLESQLQKNGAYQNANDLCCYYKSPLLFLKANRTDLAQRILNFIENHFMSSTGDFLTQKNLKSVKPEYIDYWTYINGWIVRAAQQMPHKNIAKLGYAYLLPFHAGKNKGFLTNALNAKNGITDILTTAHLGLINLERDHLDFAVSAGEYLCDALEKQPEPNRFYFRFDVNKAPITHYENEKALFYCLEKSEPNQLYFMIGYPSAYLTLLYKKTLEEKYLKAAKTYLDFALTSNSSVFESNFSHKLAWAASLLYPLTQNATHLSAIKKITQHFLSTQSKNGLWYPEDKNTAYDQSTEIAGWFLNIAHNLKQVKSKEHLTSI